MNKIIQITKLLLITWILSAILFTTSRTAFAESEKNPAKAAKNENLSEIFPDMPRFDSTSNEPVLLRYKFRTGQSVKTELEIIMNNYMSAGGQEANISMTITMDTGYTVKSVDANGDAWAALTFTRMTMKAVGPKEISFDSDKDTGNSDPNLQALKAMLNTRVPVKVSSLGKLLDVDMDPIHEAIRRAGAAAKLLDFEKTADQVTKSSFVMLSPSPVKPGDSYDAGAIVDTMGGVGEMVFNVRYKVLSISGDKKQVLLQPMGDSTFKVSPEVPLEVKLNSGKVDGWILLDLEKGYIVRSAGASSMDMSMSQGEQTMRVKVDSKIKCRSRLEDKEH